VHIVDEGVDSGPIVVQRPVEIKANDNIETLSEKILEQEHIIYPLAVKAFAEKRIDINGRVLHIKE
jgi:phosphoribosylglycinamide formyltransferase-1